jgi:hypothetical protein
MTHTGQGGTSCRASRGDRGDDLLQVGREHNSDQNFSCYLITIIILFNDS